MSRMHNPPHPGLTLRDDVLPALGMTVTDAAEALGVTRPALSRLLNGAAGVSAEMALRLERWLGVDHGGRADVWLGMQAAYDLWAAEQKAKAVIRKVKPLPAALLAGIEVGNRRWCDTGGWWRRWWRLKHAEAERLCERPACYAATSMYSTWLCGVGTAMPSSRKPST